MFDVLLLITVVFLISFIIVAIYTIFTLCCRQIPSLCNKIVFYSSAICAVISTIMIFMVVIFPTFFFGDVVVKEQYRYNISAVEDNRDIAGRFGRSIYYTRGYVEQNLYYYVGVCAGYMSHAALDFGGTGNTQQKYNYLKLAEEAYLRAISIEDRYVRALYGIGVLYVFELDESQKAIPYLEKAIEIDTRNIDAMFVLARAYYSCYEFDKSTEMYDKIINTTKSQEKKAIALENKEKVLNAQYSN